MKNQNNPQNILGDNIKQIRNTQGITQDELARKFVISYTTLIKIEFDFLLNQ